MVVPTMTVGTVIPTMIVGTAVPTIIVLTAYYRKSCVRDAVKKNGKKSGRYHENIQREQINQSHLYSHEYTFFFAVFRKIDVFS